MVTVRNILETAEERMTSMNVVKEDVAEKNFICSEVEVVAGTKRKLIKDNISPERVEVEV